MLLKDKQVAIIGGGPGGLTLARLLQQKGVNVKVYERDADQYYRQQGATLDLHYDSGLKALRAAGLMGEFKNAYRPGAERVTITDNNAKVRYTERDAEPVSNLDDVYARPEIDRGPLRDMLIASLQADTVVWNSKFLELKESGIGWTLVFDNGTIAYADLVIAADGANSRVRKYVTDIARVYSGLTIVEGNVYNAATNAPRLWELTNGGKVFAHWNSKTIVLSAKGEGSLSFYTITKEPESWIKSPGINFNQKDEVFGWFKQRFNNWSNDWHEIFAGDESYFVHRPQYYCPANQSWQPLANLTLLGDAAHQTPPSGDGVNQAMLDAVDLYESLCTEGHATVPEAIAFYESKMLARASVVTKEAMQLVNAMTAENNLQFMVDFFHTKNEL
ncbi:FAD-dependent monooxygenase [Mucilaginibacter terrenus]|uniref:FAD-dependent monooxygenase n=1 Tax=Mucilaginibacter terrenus TaxID=2482727 RepID=A0A3E2NLP8_9SPHI|nr:NAD(P)/FAD-dependent oxidoreductase [Mucilaginibacter terrenus]RFZ81830.1 FAD-dependent monooxygenase [Mucilaginibacter terrenus]